MMTQHGATHWSHQRGQGSPGGSRCQMQSRDVGKLSPMQGSEGASERKGHWVKDQISDVCRGNGKVVAKTGHAHHAGGSLSCYNRGSVVFAWVDQGRIPQGLIPCSLGMGWASRICPPPQGYREPQRGHSPPQGRNVRQVGAGAGARALCAAGHPSPRR